MSVLRAGTLVSITSTLFRVLSYVFLRIIPLRICKTVLPLLYTTYATLLLILTSTSLNQPSTSSPAYHNKQQLKSNASAFRSMSYSNALKVVCEFIFTLPAASTRLRYLSFLTNSVLLLFAADLMTSPVRYPEHDTVFARVGAIDYNSAKLSVRYPLDEQTGDLGVKIVYRPLTTSPDEEATWTDGPLVSLSPDYDWVGIGTIRDLWPSTVYEYKLTALNSSRSFLPYPSTPLQFKTFPDPRLATSSHFKFIATSCILPNFPYIPGRGDQIRGFDLLADHILAPESTLQHARSEEASLLDDADHPIGFGQDVSNKALSTEFLLFLGDFIYADVPVFFGDSIEAYRRLYRRTYASPSFRRIYEKLPILHIYDDHEIINNFAGGANDSTYPFPNASSAFELYNAQANYESMHRGQYYYDFRHGDVSFFVLDTRRYRTNLHAESLELPTMLGKRQLEALQLWLNEANQTSTFKFIVSSVPFTTLWQHDAQTDSWAAFGQERASLLDSLHTVPNLFILTGDRHEFAAIEFNGPHDWSRTVYEISTSPMNMFYVPLLRTLNMESSRHVERTYWHMSDNEDGSQSLAKDMQMLPEERVLKYIPVGNSKWSSFEIDTRDPSRPTVNVEVMVDGVLAYNWTIVGDPIEFKRSTAIGALVPQSLYEVLDKFGLSRHNWF